MGKQLLTALIPLVLFWAVEEYWGLKAALLVGCVAAVGEVGWELARTRKVGFMTLLSNGLVLGLGGISFLMDSGVAFKLQPAVMELVMAVMMILMRRKGGEPFLLRTFRETPGVDAAKRDALLAQAWFVARVVALDFRLIAFFVLHGILLAAVAAWGSTRAWILLKGVLFYVLLVLVMAPMYKRPREQPPGPALPG